MDKLQLKAALEAILFMSPEALSLSDLKRLLKTTDKEDDPVVPPDGEIQAVNSLDSHEEADPLSQLHALQQQLDAEISKSDIQENLDEIIKEYQENAAKGFELVEVAKGYQFRTKSSQRVHVKKLYKLPKHRLSSSSMETLSIVAYQQPLSRTKIEEIRGVDSGGVLKTLLERDLVRIIGRSEDPGRPILYGTTKTFLETFSLNSLSELPTLRDLENANASLGVGASSQEEVNEEAPDEFEKEEPTEELSLNDEEATGLISDLDQSMRQLRHLEDQIFTEDQKKEEPQTES